MTSYDFPIVDSHVRYAQAGNVHLIVAIDV